MLICRMLWWQVCSLDSQAKAKIYGKYVIKNNVWNILIL